MLLRFGPFTLLAATLLGGSIAPAQSSSSSSNTTQRPSADDSSSSVARPRVAQIEPGGSAVTLETSEPLFHMAAALNACGLDADLASSALVRKEVRSDINTALAGSEAARDARDKLCAYVTEHHLNDRGLDVGQYVSLSLYLSPPPDLTPSADETDLPPQALQVINVLPLLRTFSQEAGLHVLWLRHRAEYEALAARVHDPMTQMILGTNIYLHQPVSSYDGRRFLVLLEPLLSPALTNARIYGSDYIIVTSPDNSAGNPVHMEEIRHIYLHYVIEPMVYSRGSAMERLQPLLRSVSDAPLEFTYKSDMVALMTECLIKAVEARMYRIDRPEPSKPRSKERTETENYVAAKDVYDRETSIARLRLVDRDETEGWVLTGYFYGALQGMEKNGDGLRDEIAPMIYGMDMNREQQHAREIVWAKNISPDPLSARVRPRQITAMDRAELALLKGDSAAAADAAGQTLANPKASPEDQARAKYIMGRVALNHDDGQTAFDDFAASLKLSQDPRTLAWSHIYLGRLYDMMQADEDHPRSESRAHAVAEYRAALAVRDARPDTRNAAEAGLAKPYGRPQRTQSAPTPAQTGDVPFDPTGKAEKSTYKPPQPGSPR